MAGFVHADEGVLQGLKTVGRGHVPGVVAAVHVQQRVVSLPDVLHQLQHLLGVLGLWPRLMEFFQQAGSVLNEEVDVLLINVAKLFGAMTAPIESNPIVTRAQRPQRSSSTDRRAGEDGGLGYCFVPSIIRRLEEAVCVCSHPQDKNNWAYVHSPR